MPKIDFDKFKEATESTGEGTPRLAAGAYVATITAVRTDWVDKRGNTYTSDDKEYVKLIFDIAEGEYKGIYSDPAYLDVERDWAHWACLSWKNVNTNENRMSSFKGIMTAFDKSNPGFDALAAFTADKWDLFVGKQVGLVFGEEEYETNEGTIGTRLRLPNFRSVQTVREGKCKPPALKRMKAEDKARAVQPMVDTAAANDNFHDIPF